MYIIRKVVTVAALFAAMLVPSLSAFATDGNQSATPTQQVVPPARDSASCGQNVAARQAFNTALKAARDARRTAIDAARAPYKSMVGTKTQMLKDALKAAGDNADARKSARQGYTQWAQQALADQRAAVKKANDDYAAAVNAARATFIAALKAVQDACQEAARIRRACIASANQAHAAAIKTAHEVRNAAIAKALEPYKSMVGPKTQMLKDALKAAGDNADARKSARQGYTQWAQQALADQRAAVKKANDDYAAAIKAANDARRAAFSACQPTTPPSITH